MVSYNINEHVIARNNDDTGISFSEDKDRLLWPAHNLVLSSDSYNNLDLSG